MAIGIVCHVVHSIHTKGPPAFGYVAPLSCKILCKDKRQILGTHGTPRSAPELRGEARVSAGQEACNNERMHQGKSGWQTKKKYQC